MRDRRDYLIAALAAALLFAVGVLVGQGLPGLPAAHAQDGGNFDPEQPADQPANPPSGPQGGGITINPTADPRAGAGRTSAPTASDSDSNQRFVAVTCPIGSGESVLFLIDSKNEQIAVYGFERQKQGLTFLAARKIDFDLKITGYMDQSKFKHHEMRSLYERERARALADAAKKR